MAKSESLSLSRDAARRVLASASLLLSVETGISGGIFTGATASGLDGDTLAPTRTSRPTAPSCLVVP